MWCMQLPYLVMRYSREGIVLSAKAGFRVTPDMSLVRLSCCHGRVLYQSCAAALYHSSQLWELLSEDQ
jgi:hypothetical protein